MQSIRRISRALFVAAMLLTCVGCDQVTKSYARVHWVPGVTSTYAHDTLRIIYSENTGAFLSTGASLSAPLRTALFQWGVGLLVFGLIAVALFWRGLDRVQLTACALLAASGLGNLIDRVRFDGHVTDFLNLGIGFVRTGIFNLADVFGVMAVVLLLWHRGAPAQR